MYAGMLHLDMKINHERMFPSGGWLLSSIVNGQYIARRYFGYTLREAKAQFREELKNGH